MDIGIIAVISLGYFIYVLIKIKKSALKNNKRQKIDNWKF